MPHGLAQNQSNCGALILVAVELTLALCKERSELVPFYLAIKDVIAEIKLTLGQVEFLSFKSIGLAPVSHLSSLVCCCM